ncbi:MAG: hypothetical protein SFW66_08135 [Gammaproteobacteria bacterium]|nr:hypothetical protein [Gammaproteobacteria bacterium]
MGGLLSLKILSLGGLNCGGHYTPEQQKTALKYFLKLAAYASVNTPSNSVGLLSMFFSNLRNDNNPTEFNHELVLGLIGLFMYLPSDENKLSCLKGIIDIINSMPFSNNITLYFEAIDLAVHYIEYPEAAKNVFELIEHHLSFQWISRFEESANSYAKLMVNLLSIMQENDRTECSTRLIKSLSTNRLGEGTDLLVELIKKEIREKELHSEQAEEEKTSSPRPMR